MNCELKLKTGFFETRPYHLSVCPKRIVLSPADDGDKSEILISDSELIAMTFTRCSEKKIELEIHTQNQVYIAAITPNDNFQMVFYALCKEFGQKIIFEKERK